ncbi:hypothetical protein D3C71_2135110 [compost metagenome]
MVFANAEEVDAEFIRELRFLYNISNYGRVWLRSARAVVGNIAKGIEPEFYCWS